MKRAIPHLLLALCLLLVFKPNVVWANMSSGSYTIWADSVDVGGGSGTSASYIASDSISEEASSVGQSSASFLLNAGLPAIFTDPMLLFSISSASATFVPNITSSLVSSATYTFTVSTNAPFGYTVQATDDGDFRNGGTPITDVADGTVTAGSTEYGVSDSGTDAVLAGDQPLSSTPLVVASRSNWVSNSTTTMTHHASIVAGFTTGGYSHIVTYVAIGNF